MTLASRREIDWLGRKGALAARSPLPQYGPLVPKFLELRDDLIFWSWWDQQPPPSDDAEAWERNFTNPAEPADVTGMLDAFVRIEDASDIRRFAERYGVLDICEHGLPSSHNPPAIPLGDQWRECRAWGERGYLYWEPVDLWLQFVSQMRALLSLAIDIRGGSPGRMADWQVAFSGLLWVEDLGTRALQVVGKSVDLDRSALSERINTWMRIGDVRPGLSWEADSLASFHVFATTFGVLGIQLLFAATKAQGLAICDGCGMPYGPKMKPRKDRRNFCLKCGEKVAGRLRKRAWRAKSEKKGA